MIDFDLKNLTSSVLSGIDSPIDNGYNAATSSECVRYVVGIAAAYQVCNSLYSPGLGLRPYNRPGFRGRM